MPPALLSARSSYGDPHVSKGFQQSKGPDGAGENLTGAEIQRKRDREGEVASFISMSFKIKKQPIIFLESPRLGDNVVFIQSFFSLLATFSSHYP